MGGRRGLWSQTGPVVASCPSHLRCCVPGQITQPPSLLAPCSERADDGHCGDRVRQHVRKSSQVTEGQRSAFHFPGLGFLCAGGPPTPGPPPQRLLLRPASHWAHPAGLWGPHSHFSYHI